MSLARPSIKESAPFSEAIGEDKPFTLDGIRVVEANTAEFGRGEMVLLTVRGQEKELGVWGGYLLAQAKDASPEDFGKRYMITRKVVPEFSKRPVKAFVPVNEDGEEIPF